MFSASNIKLAGPIDPANGVQPDIFHLHHNIQAIAVQSNKPVKHIHQLSFYCA